MYRIRKGDDAAASMASSCAPGAMKEKKRKQADAIRRAMKK